MKFCGVPTIVLVFLLVVLGALYANGSQSRTRHRFVDAQCDGECTMTEMNKPVSRPQGRNKIRFAPNPPGRRIVYPWQRVKPGRERRPGGVSHEPTDRRRTIKKNRGNRLTRRQLKHIRRLAQVMLPFTSKLVNKLLSGTSNDFVMSPLAVHQALSMTSVGAKGSTFRELTRAIGIRKFRPRKSKIHQAYFYLRRLLSAIHQNVRVVGALGLFVKPLIPLEMTFRQDVTQFYNAHFATISSTPVKDINSWASIQTQGEFPTLISPRSVTTKTEMVLTSALCLNAPWQTTFDDRLTTLGRFYSADGKIKDILMMKQTGPIRHVCRDDLQIVQLPLSNKHPTKRLVMDIVTAGNMTELQGILHLLTSPSQIDKLLLPNNSSSSMTVVLPKFKIQNPVRGLKAALKKTGIRKAFRRQKANFEGISSSSGLYLRKLFHRGVIDVNEYGIGCSQQLRNTSWVTPTSKTDFNPGPKPPTEMIIDRPFIFAVREWTTQTYLLAGMFSGNKA